MRETEKNEGRERQKRVRISQIKSLCITQDKNYGLNYGSIENVLEQKDCTSEVARQQFTISNKEKEPEN